MVSSVLQISKVVLPHESLAEERVQCCECGELVLKERPVLEVLHAVTFWEFRVSQIAAAANIRHGPVAMATRNLN